MSASRPLRALALTLGGWTAMRAWALWPGTAGVSSPIDLAPPARAEAVVRMALPEIVTAGATQPHGAPKGTNFDELGLAQQYVRRDRPDTIRGGQDHARASMKPEIASLTDHPRTALQIIDYPETGITHSISASPPPLGLHLALTVSAWAVARGGPGGLAPGGTLGGAQAGARLFYEPGPAGVAITARISTPLSGHTGREASVGLGLRARNGGVLVERRIALERGGRDAMSATAYAGGEARLPGGIRIDGYAQGGVVGARSRDLFADGAVRAERTIAASNSMSLAAGAGAWAGAQPRVARVDIGPQLVAHIAAGLAHLRVAAEYRFRVAGDAHPGSGPAMSIGADF